MNDQKEINENKAPEQVNERFTRQDLIAQLESMVNYFPTLPKHEQFSFVTNADLYHFMVLVLNIFNSK